MLISLWRCWQPDKDRKPQLGKAGGLWLCTLLILCVHTCTLQLISCTPRPGPCLASMSSYLPLWPIKQLSLLGERFFLSGSSGSLTCLSKQAECLCLRVCARVCVSVWCICPAGGQIMVNVPTGSIHRRDSGWCQCQVAEFRRINQSWRPKRGRWARWCHQSERCLLWNAHKCAMLPVW